MKLELQELLAQKKLVEKHLAWMEEKILQLRREEGGEAASPPPDETMPDAAPPPPEFTEEADAAVREAAKRYLGAGQTDLPLRSRFGCAALFIGLAALILGLLFGLPYYCYRGAEEDTGPAEAAGASPALPPP